MTENGNFKRRVRARAAKTGESYTAARMHVLPKLTNDALPEARRLRLAVAQTTYADDPGISTNFAGAARRCAC